MMPTYCNHFRGFASCALLTLALTSLVGCVGPMACPPGCGPLAIGCGGKGCGDCSGCGELYIDPWINHPAETCDPCDICGNHNGQTCGKCRSVFDGARTMWGYRAGSDCGCCNDTACDAGPCPYPTLGIFRALACFGNAVVTCGACGEVDCGCEALVEPAFAIGCDTCGEASCGCDTGCSVCGEVNCGCDGGSYASESYTEGSYIEGSYIGGQPTPVQERMVDVKPADQPYKPSRTRKIFQSRPDIAETPKASNY